MILTRFNPCTGITTTVAKGTEKEIADHIARFASGNGIKWFDHIVERRKEPGHTTSVPTSIQLDTLKSGIVAGIVISFHVSGTDETEGYYAIIDPDAPVEPTYSKKERIQLILGENYSENAKKIQERFASLQKDAECLGLAFAFFPTDCDGVHMVALPADLVTAEKTNRNPIFSIDTIEVVKGLPWIDGNHVETLYMGEGGTNEICYKA